MNVNEIVKLHDLNVLKKYLKREEYQDSLYNRLLEYDFSRQQVDFARQYLVTQNFKIKSFLVELLCKNGNQLSEFMYLLEQDGRLIDCFIGIAERNKDQNMLLELLDQNNGKLLDVVMAIKSTGKKELLTSLFFSEDDEVVNLVRRVVEDEQQADNTD